MVSVVLLLFSASSQSAGDAAAGQNAAEAAGGGAQGTNLFADGSDARLVGGLHGVERLRL